MEKSIQLDFESVRRLLPQRFPFLMVDTVESLNPGANIIAIKNITGNEVHSLGHFPDRAIFPGVLLIEAAAQAAILLYTYGNTENAGKEILLHAVNSKFLKTVVPGDQLKIHVTALKFVAQGGMVSYECKVLENTVGSGTISFAAKAGGPAGEH